MYRKFINKAALKHFFSLFGALFCKFLSVCAQFT